jgi:hypothetical protein
MLEDPEYLEAVDRRITKTKANSNTPPAEQSASNAGLDTLLDKWQCEIKKYEDALQSGRGSADFERMTHGRLCQLEECVEDLELILGI